jgi:hypothetical protein
MSRPTEYFGQNPKNCGYRNLATYYCNLTGSTAGQKQPLFIATSSFGGTPYSVGSGKGGSGEPVLCNTWRRGECCDNRSQARDAYSNCMSGVCASYYAKSATY